MDFIRILGGQLLLPLPLAVLGLVAGTALLWLRRRERLARWLVTGGTFLLIASSTATLPRLALGSLEDDFAPYAPEAVPLPGPEDVPADPSATPPRPTSGAPADSPAWIVVLCGGGGDREGWPDLAGLSSHTTLRVAEGVRIARIHPEARVLFTGGAVRGARPCSDVMRGAAVELGLESGRIERDTTSRTTEHEAVAVAERVGAEPFVLVTAASHLPRAVALMRARGLDPIPAPAGPRAAEEAPGLMGRLIPSAEVLLGSSLWAHEVVGRIWSRLRGRI